MLLWPGLGRGRSAGGLDTLQATQIANQQHGVFVDVRPAEEYAKGHIAQARSLPQTDLEARAASLPKNKPLIVVCANGRGAGKAAAQLKAKGFEQVHTLNGGMLAWQQAGLPVSTR
ncbi:rhodanese-like domain-containing protein [Verticiella sediminum]|uniref:Rhodanese-like domain-containing protein n=1 Tax=Verticiella sediminum TaxID=1247510 RepID=A0A556AQD5_9BURK|nr:rhodanese-like domain-containing protein [Verticiella sediminum]TSH95121.1 rhodanese-like domain-containing protein [Verticiella sediminum]